MSIELRPYQVEAVEAIENAWIGGMHRPLLAMATGLGKTIVAASCIQRRGGRALILAHREELLQQAREKLSMMVPSHSIGLVRADSDEHRAPVVVASVPTLSRPARLERVQEPFDLVVVDEAHHGTATTYRRLLDHFADALALGVTATPERADKDNLAEVWDAIVYRKQLPEAVREGYLCDLRALRVQVAMDLDRVHTLAGDFRDDELEHALLDAGAPEHAVRAYQEHAVGRKALIFTPGVELAHQMADAFGGAGIAADAVDASTPREQRADMLQRFRRGELRVIANCGVLTEGYDEPSTNCIIVARPTKSRPLYVQMIGRGTRRHPGKDDCLVIDLVGVSERHDVMTVGSLFGVSLPEGASVIEELERAEQDGYSTPAGFGRPEGELVASRVELFDARRLQWACGDGLYVLAGGNAGNVAVVEREARWEVWLLGHQSERIAAGLDLEYAQGTAEDLVRRLGATTLARRDADWRARQASEAQLRLLRDRGEVVRPGITAGEASDALSLLIAGKRLRAATTPATNKQLWALRQRGIRHRPGLTIAEASRLLDGGRVA